MSYDITITFPTITYSTQVTFPSIVYTIEVSYPDITQYQIDISFEDITAASIEITFPSIVYTIEVELGTGLFNLADLQALLDLYELHLGNPGADGQILSSTVAGVRSWISNNDTKHTGTGITFSLDPSTQRYYAIVTHNKNTVYQDALVKDSSGSEIIVDLENQTITQVELWADTDPGTVSVKLH